MTFEFSLGGTFGSLAAICLAVAAVLYCARLLSIQLASRRWPRVEACITSATVERDKDGALAIRYVYAYQILDRTYTGAGTLDSSPPSDVIAEGEARAAVGRRLDLPYDPTFPQDATTQPGALTGIVFAFTIATGALVYTIYRYLAAVR